MAEQDDGALHQISPAEETVAKNCKQNQEISNLEFTRQSHAHKAIAWWKSLGSPRYVCAPMIWNSEAAFRRLCRNYGCQLAVRIPLQLMKPQSFLKTYSCRHCPPNQSEGISQVLRHRAFFSIFIRRALCVFMPSLSRSSMGVRASVFL
jgi:hypothetical protein